MQVRCNIYGLTNASTGVECTIEQSHLDVGAYFHYQDRDYVIVSVVENHGSWSANVVPENQRRFVRQRRLPEYRRPPSVEREEVQMWQDRVTEAEAKLQTLRQEQLSIGKRLDQLVHMLDMLQAESEMPRQ